MPTSIIYKMFACRCLLECYVGYLGCLARVKVRSLWMSLFLLLNVNFQAGINEYAPTVRGNRAICRGQKVWKVWSLLIKVLLAAHRDLIPQPIWVFLTK